MSGSAEDSRGLQLFRNEFADPVLTADADRVIRYANEATAIAFGFGTAEIIGLPLENLLHPEDAAEVIAKLRQVLSERGALVRFEHRVRRADAEWEFVETSAKNVSDWDGSTVLLLHLHCITNRKLAKFSLNRSEARLKEAQRVARIASFELDLRTDAVVWSEDSADILGLSEARLGTSFQDYMASVHPDDVAMVNATRARAFRLAQSYVLTHRLVTLTGALKYIEVKCELTRDREGRPRCSRGTFQDITERRDMEQRLAERQKMETVGELAGAVAHDFNNLLSVINGTAEITFGDLPADSPVRESVSTILAAGQRAASLTQQLLAFGRRQVLHPMVLDLGEVVNRFVPMLRRLIGENISVVVKRAERLGATRVDPVQIDQVLLNLAVNSRDAMPAGGTLTIQTANVILDENYTEGHPGVVPGPYVMLLVGDTGSGMDEAIQSRIFEPFFTTKRAGKGTGWGLATVYGIVKQSGGDIWCYSEVGMGTIFKVYFPRVDEAVAEPIVAASRPEDSRGTETILIVDDDEGLRRVARRILEKSGYKILLACGGEEALAKLAENETSIDLVLTDLVMPRMSGKELAKQVAIRRPGTKVLFTSGYMEDSVFEDGDLDVGAPFIMKPYSFITLPQKVREVLDSNPHETQG